MSKFTKKRGKAKAEISTSSMPDIVFMLLFFFMVATVMKEVSLKVKNSIPPATDVQKMQKRSVISYIYIGKPVSKYAATYGTSPRIQLDDAIANVDDIPAYVEKERAEMAEGTQSQMNMVLKIDKDVKYGLITDVKLELRKADARKITYAANKVESIY